MKRELETDWVQRLSLAVGQLGWRSAWIFQVSVAVCVGSAVAAVLVLLDGASWMAALAGALVAMVPALLTGMVAMNLARALARSTRQRELLSVDDELTGVCNRRQFMRLAEREWARCRRYGNDGALLLIDTDRLGLVNESLGQRGGDAVLREVTRRVGATLRQSDVLARLEGPELAVFLPHTDPLGALDAAERIRLQVASVPVRWEQTAVGVTVSVGVSHVHAGQLALEGLVHEGERALRAAKEAGRNCVRAAPIQPQASGPAHSSAAP